MLGGILRTDENWLIKEREIYVKQPRKPTLAQKKLIVNAGLDPDCWSVTLEDALYLHLVDRGMEQRQIRIIDKATGKLIK